MIIKGSLSGECFEMCPQHRVSSQYIVAIMFTNTQLISQKQKDRKILKSQILPADKTAHTTLNLKNWLLGKTISDAEILNKLYAASCHRHSRLWQST